MKWLLNIIVVGTIYTCVSGQTECDCEQGPHGPRGKRGKQGPQGPPGLAGSQGPPGLVGLPGKEGHLGTPGLNGSAGPPGQDGRPGPIGPPGNDGQDGQPGIQGVSGQPGFQGPPGLRGQQGLRGLTGYRGPPGPRGNAGVHYTRWGASTCPSTTGTELVYTGRTGGSWYSHPGGAANYLCMPMNPEYTSQQRQGVQNHNRVWGTEYKAARRDGYNDVNVPCAVCFASTQASSMMIPAKTSCPSRWRREYYGYLMSAYRADAGRTMYECVDISMEGIPGSIEDNDGAKFYHVEANCNGMPCPPYDNYKELNCVVCTR